MKPLLLARFTPSLTPPEDLEAIFVQRGPMAERILTQLHDSITTKSKHHTLLVGPRGIGKTHLITLVRHRLINRADLRPLCLVAWLREEEWGVMSFLDLLLRILRSLQDSQEVEVPADQLDSLHDLSPVRAEKEAAKILREVIGDKTLVLIMENLDDIFRGLAQREQAAFRAFLQEHACVTILATTPGLFEGVSRQKSPFFGFFRIQHLEELKFEEAAQLLHKIATRRGQDDLAAFILSPTGRARIRAIHHLAQGNPRVYVILSEFLTRQSLDDLVDPVLRMLDDLTPYYQSRLSWLSTQQRKLVEFLASHRIPCGVKELARRCFVTPQTASGQLRKLTEWGYVRSESEGRESFYELREPLMRFCLDLKKERKEPLRPLVEILRIWWTPDELELQLRCLDAVLSPTAEYLIKALEICRKESDDPRAKACRKDFHRFLEADQLDKALSVAEDWVAVTKDAESEFQLGYAKMMLGRYDEAWKGLASTSEAYPDDFGVTWLSAFVAKQAGAYKASIKLVNKAQTLPSEDESDAKLRVTLLLVKAEASLELKDYEACIACCDELLARDPNSDSVENAIWFKVRSLLHLNRFKEVESTLATATRFPADAGRYYLLAVAQYRQDRTVAALASLDHSLSIEDAVCTRLTKAKILAEEGRWEEVMPEIEKSLTISPEEVRAWTPTLSRIALLGMFRGGESRHGFLTILNLTLQSKGVPAIRVTDLMTLASKEMLSADSEPLRNLSAFFEQLSVISEDGHVLAVLKAFRQYAQTRDAAVLRQLPIEERQLIEGFANGLVKDVKSETVDARE